MRNLLKHTFSTYLGISSILIFSLQVSAQDERSNATNILSYYNNSFPLVKVKKYYSILLTFFIKKVLMKLEMNQILM